MKQATRENVEKLVEALTVGYRDFGNRERSAKEVQDFYDDIIQNTVPVYLLRVLAKIDIMEVPKDDHDYIYRDRYMLGVLSLWKQCGLERSLQEIIEESGWEDMIGIHTKPGLWFETTVHHEEEITRLKSPEARELFEYLLSIFPEA